MIGLKRRRAPPRGLQPRGVPKPKRLDERIPAPVSRALAPSNRRVAPRIRQAAWPDQRAGANPAVAAPWGSDTSNASRPATSAHQPAPYAETRSCHAIPLPSSWPPRPPLGRGRRPQRSLQPRPAPPNGGSGTATPIKRAWLAWASGQRGPDHPSPIPFSHASNASVLGAQRPALPSHVALSTLLSNANEAGNSSVSLLLSINRITSADSWPRSVETGPERLLDHRDRYFSFES